MYYKRFKASKSAVNIFLISLALVIWGNLGLAELEADVGRFLVRYPPLGLTQFMVYDKATGNVGIGTTSPNATLDVNGYAQINDLGVSGYISTVDLSVGPDPHGYGSIKIHSADAGHGADCQLHIGGQLQWRFGNVESGVQKFSIYDAVQQRHAFTVDASDPQERKVGIEVQYPSNILTVVRNSVTDPIADAWTTYSSRRWKTNIKPIEGALNKVHRLRGVSYDWKADGKHDIGLIAEEVGEVIPEVVAYEENGEDAKSVDYARLVALLIEGMKEQQQIIESQSVELTQIKAENAEIKRKMATFESALQNLESL